MQTIKRITAEIGEECHVDIDILHDALSKLPAEMYLKLYHKMQENIERQNQPVNIEVDFKQIQKAMREYEMKMGRNAFLL